MFKFNLREIIKLIVFTKPRMLVYIAVLLGCCTLDAGTNAALITITVRDAINAAVQKDMPQLLKVCAELGIVILIICTLMPFMSYFLASTVKRVMAEMRLKVFGHMEKIPVSYFENTHSGDSISRITNDIGVIENALSVNMRSIISLIFTGVTSAAIMFSMDWRIASVLILLGIVAANVNSRFTESVRKVSDEIQVYAGVLTERFTDFLAGFSIIKMFHIDEIIIGKYREINNKKADKTITRSTRYAFLDSANFLLVWIGNGGTFAIGSYMVLSGQSNIGTILAMVILMEQVTNNFRQLGNYVAQLQSSLAGAARVFEVMDIPDEPESYKTTGKCGNKGFICIKDGTFSYNGDRRAIDDLSLDLEEGSIAALVGPSGGGKSTLVKLLIGFYPIESGSIVINGKAIGEYTLTQLRDMMAYVPQDAYLFEGTIEDNIRYGRISASHDEVVSAAKAANAHEFIIEQAEGYNTMVGERGERLSGGQKQRIAIARALLKDAPILLLDEATSALDSESEQLVQDALNILMKGRTTIAIAHRLSTIEHADMIYVIDEGKVVEQGRHEELLSTEGLYSRLHKVQFRHTEPEEIAG